MKKVYLKSPYYKQKKSLSSGLISAARFLNIKRQLHAYLIILYQIQIGGVLFNSHLRWSVPEGVDSIICHITDAQLSEIRLVQQKLQFEKRALLHSRLSLL